ncbi:lytic transglycosylase domain-containing protein [Burkholderia ubonensis]|uniref:lytic transglycosylase domain-containing protein n=1 Tax=Burkholderia ubonensis TaxID=101571 RepID=UPI00075C9142|nr:lytic transglycosylase domain-containing protein [Burkholderia ubonensis]KVL70347.1 lytic transglycosylase [Burkholderia ubonensis]KVL73210.1 lytic transglycosylase [Burkholderia ubonensis]KVL91038.1 lytic transglycosylase [Burkholderia ubonensis]
MMPLDFATLAQQCAPSVHPTTLQAVVKTESGFNPYAIGVVGGRLVRQPRSRDEAVATARALEAAGWNYSMGLAQVNRANLRIYGLTAETVFDPCANLRAGGAILTDCYTRASAGGRVPQDAVRASLSCYYSGNFTRGFKADSGGTSYVQRVAANAIGASGTVVPPIAVVPDGAAPAARGAARAARVRRVDDASTTGADRARETDHHPAWDALGDF